LSGDPTVYGLTQFKMPERGKNSYILGYEIVRQNILNENNHGYGDSSGNASFK